MIEHALRRLYGERAPDVAALRRRRRQADIRLAAGSLVLALGLLPLLYAALLPDVGFSKALSGDSLTQILTNAAANAIVMVWALRLNGQVDRKLAAILSRALIVHGALSFWILIAREPHSNQVMLMAAAASLLLGPMIVAIRHRGLEARAALLGAWHPFVEQVQIPCDWIRDPKASLASYDVLLTSTVVDLPPEWATAVTREMLMGKPVRLLAVFVEETQGTVCLEHFDLDHLPQAGLTSYRTRKRLMDVALVLIALPVALPLILIGAMLILVTMGRPIMFIQPRVGLGGRVFRMFKLRTMQVSSPDAAATATASRDDARITRVGRWLRRFRIDELPQLWNVLIGDMSVIGPRPEWTKLSDSYMERLPVYAYRHLVRPGITGWAQVKGGYAADLDQTRAKVGYDLFYIKYVGFSLDVRILIRTVWTLLSGSGAR